MNPYDFFQFFLPLQKYRFWKKNWGYNHATVSLITRKILMCVIKFCDQNMQNS